MTRKAQRFDGSDVRTFGGETNQLTLAIFINEESNLRKLAPLAFELAHPRTFEPLRPGLYSARRALIGSIDVARRAGPKDAASAATRNASVTPANATRSVGSVAKSR